MWLSLVIATLLLPDYRATSVPDLLAALWVRAPGSRRRQMRPVRAGTAMTAPNPETEARIPDAGLTAAGRCGVRRLTVGSVCAQARYHRPLQGQRGRACVSFAGGNLLVAGWPDDDPQP